MNLNKTHKEEIQFLVKNADVNLPEVLRMFAKEYHKKQLTLTDVVQQSEQYCECEKPTLGKSISRCGTCDEWFKPLK